MAAQVRRDGETTRAKLLEAACGVFGEKGFRDATNAEICKRAHANIAAINYHFGSKANLYRAVWKHGAQCAEKLYPMDGSLPPHSPAHDKLRALVKALVNRRSDRRNLGHFHRIRMSEMFSPTGHLDEVMMEQMSRTRDHVDSIVSDVLGSKATKKDIEMCERSVVSQCFTPMVRPRKRMSVDTWARGAENADEIAEHVFQFSLAGIQATRERIERRGP